MAMSSSSYWMSCMVKKQQQCDDKLYQVKNKLIHVLQNANMNVAQSSTATFFVVAADDRHGSVSSSYRFQNAALCLNSLYSACC